MGELERSALSILLTLAKASEIARKRLKEMGFENVARSMLLAAERDPEFGQGNSPPTQIKELSRSLLGALNSR